MKLGDFFECGMVAQRRVILGSFVPPNPLSMAKTPELSIRGSYLEGVHQTTAIPSNGYKQERVNAKHVGSMQPHPHRPGIVDG